MILNEPRKTRKARKGSSPKQGRRSLHLAGTFMFRSAFISGISFPHGGIQIPAVVVGYSCRPGRKRPGYKVEAVRG
jgi:hypothetical protein